MANGIIVIDKPSGWTSMDVCAKIRGVLHERGKEYVAGLRLGVVTNTQDTSGTVLEERPVAADRAALEAALAPFRGDILQIPPMYSAIKRDGKKLYELARKGQEVEREPRPVTIYGLEVVEQAGPADYLLRVRCSKGTYVRTLCHDIGQALGCGGCMYSLRRTEAAGFSLNQAVTLDALLSAEDPQRLLLPVDAYFSRHPALTLPPAGEKKVRNGTAVSLPRAADGQYRVYGESGAFLALGQVKNGRLTTIKSFFEV